MEEAFTNGFAGAALEEHIVGQDDSGAAVDLEQAADVLEEVELLVAGGGPEVVAQNLLALLHLIAILVDDGDAGLFAEWRVGEHHVVVDRRLGDEAVLAGSDVLLVAAEDNQQRLQSRIVKLHKGEWPDTLHLATGIPRLDDGGIEELERFHDDHPELRLVGLDVWQSVRGKERSRNQYADDYSAIEDIQNFASDHGVAVLILHHHRKAPDVDTFNKFSGSTGIMGSADTGWSLERERGQCDASFITTGRDIKELELALSFDEDTCEWIGLGPLDEYQHSQEKSKIIRVLRDSGPIGPKDIAEALDKNVSTIRTYLGRMLDAGEIEKVGRGEYVAKESVTLTDFKESS